MVISNWLSRNYLHLGDFLFFLSFLFVFICLSFCSLTTKGFASLEAKRNFRAPRVSPNHSSPIDNSSISPSEHVIVADASCKTDTLSSSPGSKSTNNSVSDVSELLQIFVHLNTCQIICSLPQIFCRKNMILIPIFLRVQNFQDMVRIYAW